MLFTIMPFFMAPSHKALVLEICNTNKLYCYDYYTHINEGSAI